jgi:molecular chaperone DnaJ
MSKDYYSILGVEKGSSKEDIKKAYKKMARKYHPDVSKESDAEQKFKDINEAASVLLDDEKRKRYDTYGSADGPSGFGGGGGFNPEDFGINLDDIFEQFGFGSGFGGGFGGFSSSRRKNKDTRVYEEISITLDEVYHGVEKSVKITRDVKCNTCNGRGAKNPSDIEKCSYCNGSGVVIETQRSFLGAIRTQRTCPKCGGTGEIIKNPCEDCSGDGFNVKKETVNIKIPAGIENGVTLRVQGKGSYDKLENSYGDLFLKVYVKKDKLYDVDGSDLYRSVDVNFIQAILGDEIDIKHFGKTLSVKVPAGTQSGTILRLKSKGLPNMNYSGNGDLYLKINVEIPNKTTAKQKEILLDYAKTIKDKNFFDRIKNLFK